MVKGSEWMFFKDSFNPLFQNMEKIIPANPNEHLFPDMEAIMPILSKKKTVLLSTRGMVYNYFKSNPFYSRPIIEVNPHQMPFFNYMALSKNSPLKPILQHAFLQNLETGLTDHLIKIWEGDGIPLTENSVTMALTFKDLVFVFSKMFSVIVFVLFIMIGEVLWKQLQIYRMNKLEGAKLTIWVFGREK